MILENNTCFLNGIYAEIQKIDIWQKPNKIQNHTLKQHVRSKADVVCAQWHTCTLFSCSSLDSSSCSKADWADLDTEFILQGPP